MAHIPILRRTPYIAQKDFQGFSDCQLHLANTEHLHGLVESLYPMNLNEPYDYHVGQGHEIIFKSSHGRSILVGPNAIKVRCVRGSKIRHTAQLNPIMRDPELKRLMQNGPAQVFLQLDMPHHVAFLYIADGTVKLIDNYYLHAHRNRQILESLERCLPWDLIPHTTKKIEFWAYGFSTPIESPCGLYVMSAIKTLLQAGSFQNAQPQLHLIQMHRKGRFGLEYEPLQDNNVRGFHFRRMLSRCLRDLNRVNIL